MAMVHLKLCIVLPFCVVATISLKTNGPLSLPGTPETFPLMYDVKIEAFDPRRK